MSGGTDDPGALAVLILGAHALGDNPRDVGGSDLVARLQATVTTKGQDAGLYGAQDPTYDGAYRQGLALVALAAAGVKGTATAAARGWLTGQQCATDGGWEAYRTDLSLACTAPDPSTYSGPDTNSTALAIEGLAAQGAAVPASALDFLQHMQNADGGWSYYGGPSDPDSTALVIQAIVAAGRQFARFDHAGGTPGSGLLQFVIRSGDGVGAFSYPGESGPNLIASYQAIPAALATAFPATGGSVSYALATSDGGVRTFGHSAFHGSLPGIGVSTDGVVAVTGTPSGNGYWLTTSTGGVFTFGDAGYHGSTGGAALRAPIVGMAATPDGGGYWLVAADGGVFTFGDAGYHGSTGGTALRAPIVGMAATPDGGGYWLVAADGGVFTFGNAVYHGSTGGTALRAPIVGMAATPDGGGYWLVAADGGVFTFGNAVYHGSTGGTALRAPIVGMAATPDGGGYWLVAADGGVFTFGDAPFDGAGTGSAITVGMVVTGPST